MCIAIPTGNEDKHFSKKNANLLGFIQKSTYYS